MRHARRVRGSPLVRTLLLVAGLLLAGWGMLRFAAASGKTDHAPVESIMPVEAHVYGFAVKLSAPAKSLDLKARDGRVLFHGEAAEPLSGTIPLDPADPVVFVSVAWQSPATTDPRFVKLTLEPPGKATLVHYFEAPGDFEDVWELPAE